MSKGKRYTEESNINIKKVISVAVIILFFAGLIFIIVHSLKQNIKQSKTGTIDYFAIYADNKWGIIDSSSKEIIPPSYQEMIVIPDKSADVFICTYDIDEENGTYKTKALNKKQEEIFTGYSQVEAIENYDENQNVWYEKDILRVKKDDKYGLINLKGEEILRCEYDNIYPIVGIENSLIVEKDGKQGLVNNTGKIVINPTYKEIKALGKDYKQGYITVDDNGKQGVISYLEEQILENKYDKIKPIYAKNFFVVEENDKTRVINAEGKTIIDDGFDEIEQILEANAKVSSSIENAGSNIDETGATMTNNTDAGNNANAEENQNSGENQSSGENQTADGNSGEDQNTDGTQNSEEGQNSGENQNTDGNQNSGETQNSEDNSSNKIGVGTNETKPEEDEPINMFIFKKDDKYGVIDENKKIIIKSEYENLKGVKQGLFIAKQNGKYGVIDAENNTKILFEYESISYNEKANIFIADDEQYNSSIIDSDYNVKLKGILSEINTEKGFIKMRIDDKYKYYNLKLEEKKSSDIYTNSNLFLSKKDDKYGYVDKDDNVVVDYIYDDATELNEYGFAAVKKDGLWGSLDCSGNVVIEPTYDLDKNLVVDFIGKWHLGEDSKMNYYCEK